MICFLFPFSTFPYSEGCRAATNKKSRGGKLSKAAGPKFTMIGGQKVDMNCEKPQYLKLTLEQIQLLALQQRSGQTLQLKILMVDQSVSM